MSPRDDRLLVSQMLEYALAVRQRVAGFSREEFDRSTDFQSRVMTLLQNIGEAARNVSGPVEEAHPEIAWTKIIGMRHWLVHGYDRIDFDIVWDTATTDIPHLVTTLSNLLL